MTNPNNPTSSAIDQAGSDKAPENTAGQAPGNGVNYEKMYNELQSKFGDQGRELGEFRKFFEEISPVLDPLDKSPNTVKAIINGKINDDMALAAMEGRVVINEKVVEKAHDDVKKDMGTKAYDKASPEEISKMVEDRIREVEKKMQESIRENEDLRSFESRVNDFVNRTPDFSNHAKEIEEWLENHKDINDIEIAYHAVKGALSVKEASKIAEEEAIERAKDLALNASGGTSKATHVSSEDRDIIDSLIASKSNPNTI